ncbi:MAG: DMT family transporter [Deltaproteobacteria bacterium]|nr:DMT family transporter [Deltaproteobacteria bacterium]
MNKFQANALLMVAAIIWGTTFVVQQVGTGGLEAIMFTGVRTLVGACFILPMALRQFQKVRRRDLIFTVSDWL